MADDRRRRTAMSMKPQMPVCTTESDETLSFIRQMGIEYVSLMLKREEITYECVKAQQERLARFGMTVSDVVCSELQKNRSIHLNLPDRENQIEELSTCSMCWERQRCPLPPLHGSLTAFCAPAVTWENIQEEPFPLSATRRRS